MNTRSRQFADVSSVSGLDFMDDGRAIAIADWDWDGRLDLWFSNRTAPRLRFMRNQVTTNHHFIAVQLKGRTCNRDAIGARVEVYENESRTQPFVKTLRAGEGFLGQSSKWLHFGLGDCEKPVSIVVRWPGGGVQEYSTVAVDHRYVLVQGVPEAEIQQRPEMENVLKPGYPAPSEKTDAVRIVLASPLPAPVLRYHEFDGLEKVLYDETEPLLINLWASWCQPCLKELADFKQHETRIRNAGLKVVALSVDGFGPSNNISTPEDARKLIQRIALKWDSGVASTALLDKVDLILSAVTGKRLPLSLPTSLLIDSEGRVSIVYKGPIEMDQLIEDLDLLQMPMSKRYIQGMPYLGSWFSDPPQIELRQFAEVFRKRGYIDDAKTWLSELVERSPDDSRAHNAWGMALYQQGQISEAMTHFQSAIDLDDQLAPAHNNMGMAYHSQGNLSEAVRHFREALRIDPKLPEVHDNLGQVYVELGQVENAKESFTEALRRDPDFDTAKQHMEALEVMENNFLREDIDR